MHAQFKESTHLLMVAAAGLAFSVTSGSADTVNISADDGKVQVTGQVTNVAERTITIKTNVGLLTFDVDTIKCDGIGCPREALDKVQPTSSAI